MENRLTALCDRFRAKLAGLTVQAGLARMAVVALALAPVLWVVDWWLVLGWPGRLMELAAFLAVLGSLLWWTILRPLRHGWSNQQILAYLDSAGAGKPGMLLDLYELARQEDVQELESPVGRQMAESAVAALVGELDSIEVGGALQRRPARRALTAAVATVVLFASLSVPMWTYVRIGSVRLFNPFSSVRWPHRTTIELAAPAGGWYVAQMESFTVKAAVSGEIPPQVSLTYRGKKKGQQITERLPVRMDGALGRVEYTFAEVPENLSFYLRGGDFHTDTIELRILERPFVTGIEAGYHYPAFARLPDRTTRTGQVAGLEGTTVRLIFTSSMPLDKMLFVLNEADKPLPPELLRCANKEGTVFEKELVLSRDGRYSLELHESHGLREARPERYEISVTPDNPPEVEILSPARDLVETRQACIDVSLSARDDFGLEKVELLYQVDDHPPEALSGRITGPIAQTGKSSAAAFTWDLRKMPELPDRGTITYFARAKDCNPSPGRKPVESSRFKIKLVRPSEFHLEAFEKARLLLAEAQIAWREQLHAYTSAGQWLARGTGAEDDKLWLEIEDKQEVAGRAGRAVAGHLQTIIGQYQRNHMESEFMAARVGDVAGLVHRLTQQELPAIEGLLAQARPKLAADAAPDRLKARRADAAGKFKDNQKLAVLILERVLRKLYDWRDLQNASITTRLLQERQEETLATTEKIAPKYIGKDILDLSDKEQEDLLTLGKSQRTIYETETELERQLADTLRKAELQKRRAVQAPINTAFKLLRDNRVNDHLKLSAGMIETNQPYQIVKNQKQALLALNVVVGGLVLAGQSVEPAEGLDLAANVRPEADFEEVEVKVASATTASAPSSEPAIALENMDAARLLEALPEGSDPLSAGVRQAIELQDNVLARTRFLQANLAQGDMPRFRRLAGSLLLDRQDKALAALAKAAQEAAKVKADVAGQVLTQAAQEGGQARQLTQSPDYSAAAQQLQADTLALLKDLLTEYLPMEKTVADLAAEHRKGQDLDPFKRPYVLRGPDLDAGVAALAALDHARLMQRDVARKLDRLAKFPSKGGAPAVEIDAQTRQSCLTLQSQVAVQVASARQQLKGLSKEVESHLANPAIAAAMTVDLEAVVEQVRKASAQGEELAKSAATLSSAVDALRELLGAVVEPATVAKVAATQASQPITAGEFEALTSPEAIREKLAKDTRLPPDIRAAMLNSLSQPLPPKYQELLKRYYASFAEGANE